MGFRQANSPNDLPAGRTIHVRCAFQLWTVQADLEAKLYVYGRPKPQASRTKMQFALTCHLFPHRAVPSNPQNLPVLIANVNNAHAHVRVGMTSRD
jgi:hypothetical protein